MQTPVRVLSDRPLPLPLHTPHDGEPLTPSEVTSEPDWLPSTTEADHLVSEADFAQNRDALTQVIDASSGLIQELVAFNKERWAVRIPRSTASVGPNGAVKRLPLVRAATSFGPRQPRPHALRSNTTIDDIDDVDADEADDACADGQLHILTLPLHLDPAATGPHTLEAVMANLTQKEVSNYLNDRLEREQRQLRALLARVQDRASKVLITGDLNAGKSTFVNALLRRPLMPVDQQPCTTVFCEVLDADAANAGAEEIHALRPDQLEDYQPGDRRTFTRFDLARLEEVACAEDNTYALVKIYTHDARPSTDHDAAAAGASLLSNGLVDIALIDAPGLNRDTLSTTALFARQSEIDVVVFLVSAENHFTLSAKEFLFDAARDKAYVFVVVNKFAGIRDKARCQRLVADQLRKLSPLTYVHRAELVHYVESAAVDAAGGMDDEAFRALEAALRSFVLLKRSASKLLPAKHYLSKLLADLTTVGAYNARVARGQLDTALAELAQVRPVFDRLVAAKGEVADEVARVEEARIAGIRAAVWARLERALACVRLGQLVPPSDEPTSLPAEAPFRPPTELPPYPGLLGLWQWAAEVKEALLLSLEGEVRKAEEAARAATVQGHDEIMHGLARRFLPDGGPPAAGEREFRPQVMFAGRRQRLAKLQQRRGVGAVGLGPGAFGKVDVSVLDLFDLDRLNPFAAAPAVSDDVEAAGALSVVSLGVGAMTMFGSRAVGVRGFVEAAARVADVLGSPHARKWAGPVIGVLTAGLAVYVIYDLPRAVPHNIGRKLHASLLAASADSALERPGSFVAKQADDIADSARRGLRACGYELHQRFHQALKTSEQALREVELSQAEAEAALAWLGAHLAHVAAEEAKLAAVELEAL